MLVSTRSVTVTADHTTAVHVHAHVPEGTNKIVSPHGALPSLTQETFDRVRAAVRNSGLPWPATEILLMCHHGPLDAGTDLAVAVATMAASASISVSRPQLASVMLLGELSLNGTLRPVSDVLARVHAARATGVTRILLPAANAADAAAVEDVAVIPVATLADAVAWLSRKHRTVTRTSVVNPLDHNPVLAGARLPPDTVQALVLAAAGRHHALGIGPSGSEASLLGRLLVALLPDLSDDDATQATVLHSATEAELPSSGLATRPPLTRQHHCASFGTLIGRVAHAHATRLRPGAVSLAHAGVLHLDQIQKFSGYHQDTIASVLDHRQVRLMHAGRMCQLPADLQLLLTGRECPCDATQPETCTCSPAERTQYRRRLHPRLADRIDIRLPLRPSFTQQPPLAALGELRARVREARDRAAHHWHGLAALTNGDVPEAALHRALPAGAVAMLDAAVRAGLLTERGRARCLRVAWTRADLAGHAHPTDDDVAAAIELRRDPPTPAG